MCSSSRLLSIGGRRIQDGRRGRRLPPTTKKACMVYLGPTRLREAVSGEGWGKRKYISIPRPDWLKKGTPSRRGVGWQAHRQGQEQGPLCTTTTVHAKLVMIATTATSCATSIASNARHAQMRVLRGGV